MLSFYNAKYLHSNTLTSLAINLPLVALVLGKELHMVLFNLLRQNLLWRIGDDTRVSFWTDLWLLPHPLSVYALPSATVNLQAKVCEFWDQHG